jgi:hypothetical protein
MKRLLFVLILFVASGCSVFDLLNATASVPTPNIRITTNDFDGVIFTADNTENHTGLVFEFNDPIVEYWTPTEEQVLALEAGVADFLDGEIPAEHYGRDILDRLSYYRRQYFGIGFSEGEQLIYASYFCPGDYFDYWLEGNVAVEDGGECFFQVFYDPKTGRYSELQINGMA